MYDKKVAETSLVNQLEMEIIPGPEEGAIL
jgi:hypothetical protein